MWQASHKFINSEVLIRLEKWEKILRKNKMCCKSESGQLQVGRALIRDFIWDDGLLSPTAVLLIERKRTVHSWAALHFYSIANFVTSWLKWLQMISNNSKWFHLTYQTHRDSFGVIPYHLESINSKGDKIIYTYYKHGPLLKITLSLFAPSRR